MKIKNIILLIIVSLIIIISAIVLLINIGKSTKQTKFNISGKYICSNDYFNNEPFIKYSDYIPTITFYDNSSCSLLVHYGGGKTDVNCSYFIKEDIIQVKLNIKGSFFDAPDAEGYPFMEEQYNFTIIDNNHITINKGFYTVDSGDLFIKK